MDDYFDGLLRNAGNLSNLTTGYDSECGTNLSRESCNRDDEVIDQQIAISVVKLFTASLSVAGSLSVIIAILARQKAWSHETHPLLMLCIGDFVLAALYLVGGAMFLKDEGTGLWYTGCFAISTATIVMEGVTTALTVVYAAFAYAHVRHIWNPISGLPMARRKAPVHPCVVITVYILAWIVPIVATVTPVRIIGSLDNTFKEVAVCTCWCMPSFGNILPFAFPRDEPRARLFHNVVKIVAVEGGIVGTSFMLGLVLIGVFYFLSLRQIRRITQAHKHYNNVSSVKQTAVMHGQRRARNRIIAFLTVFCVIVIFNGVFAFIVMGGNAKAASEGISIREESYYFYYYYIHLLQAFMVPSQGFLNAIIYGWTRKAFLRATLGKLPERIQNARQKGLPLEDSAKVPPCRRSSYHTFESQEDQEETFTHTVAYPNDESGETQR